MCARAAAVRTQGCNPTCHRLQPYVPQVLAAAFEAVLRRRWSESARYMTFLETEKLAADSLALRFKGFWEGGPQAGRQQ